MDALQGGVPVPELEIHASVLFWRQILRQRLPMATCPTVRRHAKSEASCHKRSPGPPGFYLLAGLHHASRCQERSRRTGIDRRRGSPRARGRMEELCPCSQRFCEVDRHRRARALRVSLHIRTCTPQSSGEGLFLSIAGGPRHRLRTTSRCKSFSSNCTDPRTGSLRFIAPWMEARNSYGCSNRPTATTTPAEAARYPRYISDLLRTKCNADSQQLIERELTLKGQIDDANGTAGDVAGIDRFKAQLTALQGKRSAVERCVAASQEKERLTQFARFCPGACDRPLIE